MTHVIPVSLFFPVTAKILFNEKQSLRGFCKKIFQKILQKSYKILGIKSLFSKVFSSSTQNIGTPEHLRKIIFVFSADIPWSVIFGKTYGLQMFTDGGSYHIENSPLI